ncbi:MAG: class I tRNA ligase family protein [Thermoanaerobaculia bacterium]
MTRDFERLKFNNPAVAALMELLNGLTKATEKTASKRICEETLETLVQLLHPLAPHVTEELWEMRGHGESLLDSDWPVADESKLKTATRSSSRSTASSGIASMSMSLRGRARDQGGR